MQIKDKKILFNIVDSRTVRVTGETSDIKVHTADNEITLHTGKNYVYYRTTAGGALAAATYQNSGYLLVQAWK